MPITRERGVTRRGFAGLWSSLTRTASQLEADQVAEHVRDGDSVSTPMAECSLGTPVCVEGLVRAITLRPPGESPAVEIDLFDGTSSVSVKWIGRRRISGIAPGRRLVVHGRLAGTERQPIIYNPRYELRPGSE